MIPLENQDLLAVVLTFELALVTTLFLVLLGTPLAWWLARTKSGLRTLIEPIVALPLILPPTVVGFYLLLAFAPTAWFGSLWTSLVGSSLAFSFQALVIGSIIYSLPFYVQPLQIAFENLDEGLLETTATLGAGPLDRFFTLVIPLSRRGFLTAMILGFAHTVGEFGIVLMIGGSIPGKTRVLSIAIYDHVESLQYQQAHILAAGMLIFSFLLLCIVYGTNRQVQLKNDK